MPEFKKRLLIACSCLLLGSLEVFVQVLNLAPSR
jgi:hypothetical protein